jgi:hypothetical protein
MDVLAFLGETGRLLLRVLVVIAPLLVWQWTFTQTRVYRDGTGPAALTVVASSMVGLAALTALLPDTTMTWDAIVAPGGFWDLSLPEFLWLAAGIARRALPNLLATLQFDDDRSNFQAWLAAAFALWFLRMAIGLLVVGPPGRGRRFLIHEFVTFVVGVFGAIYAGPLLLWSINRLNFWLLLVAIVLIQDCRYDEPPLVLRLAARLTQLQHRHHHLPDASSPP